MLAHGYGAQGLLVRAIPRHLDGHPDEQHAANGQDDQDGARSSHASQSSSTTRAL